LIETAEKCADAEGRSPAAENAATAEAVTLPCVIEAFGGARDAR
jgi:hypothetical protein